MKQKQFTFYVFLFICVCFSYLCLVFITIKYQYNNYVNYTLFNYKDSVYIIILTISTFTFLYVILTSYRKPNLKYKNKKRKNFPSLLYSSFKSNLFPFYLLSYLTSFSYCISHLISYNQFALHININNIILILCQNIRFLFSLISNLFFIELSKGYFSTFFTLSKTQKMKIHYYIKNSIIISICFLIIHFVFYYIALSKYLNLFNDICKGMFDLITFAIILVNVVKTNNFLSKFNMNNTNFLKKCFYFHIKQKIYNIIIIIIVNLIYCSLTCLVFKYFIFKIHTNNIIILIKNNLTALLILIFSRYILFTNNKERSYYIGMENKTKFEKVIFVFESKCLNAKNKYVIIKKNIINNINQGQIKCIKKKGVISKKDLVLIINPYSNYMNSNTIGYISNNN